MTSYCALRTAGIGLVAEAERSFRAQIAITVPVMMGMLLPMAESMTFAVVYPNAF